MTECEHWWGPEFLLDVIQLGSEAHPVYWILGLFPGLKRLVHEADHSPLASAKFKKT
jgi:hypothetical protein